MKRIIFLVLLGTVISCKSTKEGTTRATDYFQVENLAQLNVEEIKQNFSDAQIREDVGMFEEGTIERPYLILYPDSVDEIQITWEDSRRKKIHDIRFTGEGKWHSSQGIKIGTSYEELNKINGRPISFYGFGWDYSGAVMWNDGALENTKLRVFLAPEKDPDDHHYGDHILKVTPEEASAMNLRVRTIIYKM